MSQFDPYIPYAALLIACSFAVVTDLRARRIPNAIPIALAVTALAFRALHGPIELLVAVATIIVILGAGTVAFSFRWLGGGDIKLLAAGCACLTPDDSVSFLLLTAVGGGVLALATAAVQGSIKQTITGALTILQGVRTDPSIPVAPTSQIRLPYAIAITFGALSLTLMHTFAPGLRVF